MENTLYDPCLFCQRDSLECFGCEMLAAQAFDLFQGDPPICPRCGDKAELPGELCPECDWADMKSAMRVGR